MRDTTLYDHQNKLDFLVSIGHLLPDGSFKYSRTKRTFLFMSESEVEYNQPFYLFDERQTLEYLQELLGSNGGAYSEQILSLLRRYMRWCEGKSIITTKQMLTHPVMEFSASPRARKELERKLEIADIFADYRNSLLSSYEEFVQFNEVFFNAPCYEMTRAVCCLSWLGFTAQEIRYIKLADFDLQAQVVAGKKIEEGYILKTLKTVSESNGYTGNGLDARNYLYQKTKYLIRTARKPTKHAAEDESDNVISISAIRAIPVKQEELAQKLPSNHPFSSKRLTVGAIMRSGSYWKVYQKQFALKELSQEDLLLSKSPSYNKWKQCFHPQL